MFKLFDITPGKRLEIKETPDASAVMVGLDVYNRSKIPNTMEIIYTGRGRDGRFLTGIDEESHELGLLLYKAKTDPEKKKILAIKEQTRLLREKLQVLLGIPDLSATSSYWETFKVSLHRLRFIDLAQPLGVLTANMLRAHDAVMPDLSEPGNPRYFRTKFYFHDSIGEVERSIKKTQPKDKAMATLYNMYEGKDNRLMLIGHILFPQADNLDTLGLATIYQQIRFHIENAKNMENAQEFNSLATMEVRELTTRFLFRKASNRGLIKTIKNEYNFNGKKLGRNIEDAVRVLMSADGEATLLDMQDALNKTELVHE